ncbi:MAG: phytoene desaturase family protein [Candidatus Acidiferrales bacterium]
MGAVRDIVIIGAGHNALVAAFYLARAGKKPLVLESRAVAGGIFATNEILPGFRAPALVHCCSPFAPRVARDMQLERHGLEMISPATRVCAPTTDGRMLRLSTDLAASAKAIDKFSRNDAAKFIEFAATLARLGKTLAPVLEMTPPNADRPSAGELWKLAGAGRKLRSLGRKEMMQFLRWGPMAVADLVGEIFETEIVRAMVAARGIFGAGMGPWSAGTAAILLLRAARDAHPPGRALFPRGGMGALGEAMATAAKSAGAEIRTGARVEKILVKNHAVQGVVIAGGEEIAARAVVSGTDPRTTFLKLLDAEHLAPKFLLKMQNYRSQGVVAKVNLALDALPALRGILNGAAEEALGGRIHIGAEIDELERAFDASKYGEFSARPYLDVSIPSILDKTLAPEGKHVMSVMVQYAPRKLKQGDWDSKRDALGDTVVRRLEEVFPDLPAKILARQVLTPQDIERDFGLNGGHIFHGELALDQLFATRPVLGCAQYRAPIRGLYLCGSGTHPGVSHDGAPGANAAREILKDMGR